jgi:hypothetical protein
MKAFVMERAGDAVAEGIEFSDGSVAVKWTAQTGASLAFWPSLEILQQMFGNGDGITYAVTEDLRS